MNTLKCVLKSSYFVYVEGSDMKIGSFCTRGNVCKVGGNRKNTGNTD